MVILVVLVLIVIVLLLSCSSFFLLPSSFFLPNKHIDVKKGSDGNNSASGIITHCNPMCTNGSHCSYAVTATIDADGDKNQKLPREVRLVYPSNCMNDINKRVCYKYLPGRPFHYDTQGHTSVYSSSPCT